MAHSLRPMSTNVLAGLTHCGAKAFRAARHATPNLANSVYSLQLRPKTNYQEFIRHRSAAVDQKPKITTHYTIHPRENDPRWAEVDMERSVNCDLSLFFVVFSISILI